MNLTSTYCIYIFSITKMITENTPFQTTTQENIMNHCLMDKLVIFCSVVVVLKHEFFHQNYLIIDTLSEILAGPDI